MDGKYIGSEYNFEKLKSIIHKIKLKNFILFIIGDNRPIYNDGATFDSYRNGIRITPEQFELWVQAIASPDSGRRPRRGWAQKIPPVYDTTTNSINFDFFGGSGSAVWGANMGIPLPYPH